jgi:two-component system, OmpR family, sensor histidine kinase BaeS
MTDSRQNRRGRSVRAIFPRVKLSIRSKLIIILAIISLLSVVVMAFISSWRDQRNYVRTVQAEDERRIPRLINSLADYYAANQSWEHLRDNPAAFVDTAPPGSRNKHGDRRPPPPRSDHRPPHHAPVYGPPDSPHSASSAGLERINDAPLPNRLLLLDTDLTKIVGYGDSSDSSYPIEVGNEIVGWLGVENIPVFKFNPLQQVFIGKEMIALFAATAIMVTACLFAAIWFARQFEKPITALARQAHDLTNGNYQSRTELKRGDELGQFAQDLNRLAHTLQQTEQQRKQWLADASHELRTPIAILVGEIEAFKDNIRQPTPEALQSLAEEINHLSKLVENIHTLSLIDESIYHQGAAEKIDLNNLLANVINGFESLAYQKQHRFTVELQHDLTVNGNSTRLRQVFSNLISNSLRYTSVPGETKITSYREDDSAVVLLQDTPPCPTTDEMQQLFDRFYRTDSSRNRAIGGSGLGLSICLKIITVHGGSIHAYQANSGGLGVKLTLPLDSRS